MYCLPPEAFKNIEYHQRINEKKRREEIIQANHDYKMHFFKKGIDCIEMKDMSKNKQSLSEDSSKNLFPLMTKEETEDHWKIFVESRMK